MKIYLGVKGWLVSASLTVAAAGFFGMMVGTYAAKRPPPAPEPPAQCVEKSFVDYDRSGSVWDCTPPGRSSVSRVAEDKVNSHTYFLYRCTCPIRGVGRDEVVQIVGEALGAHESWLEGDDAKQAAYAADAGTSVEPLQKMGRAAKKNENER